MSRLQPDLVLSDNAKTGKSINTGHSTCRPTRLCRRVCYGRYVSGEMGRAEGLHTNDGWITKPKQVRCYERNAALLRSASLEMNWFERQAERIQGKLARGGLDNVRLCGMGDLEEGLCALAVALEERGVHAWGFSKKPEMISLIAELCAGPDKRPYIIGSTDASMSESRVRELVSATERLNGRGTLAYMCMEPGWVGQQEAEDLPSWWREPLAVIFGYHTNRHKTAVMHELACPSTNGLDVHCQECRRCMSSS